MWTTLASLEEKELIAPQGIGLTFDITDKGRARFDATVHKRRKRMGASADLANDAATIEILKRRNASWGPVE